MIKFGHVLSYNEKTGVATIEYVRPDACAKCGACQSMNKTGSIELRCDCSEGDWVRIVMPEKNFMGAMTIAYGIPLALFLLGLALGYTLSGQSEGWALLGSFIGLAVSLICLKLNEKRIAGKPGWTPRVDAVYKTKPEMDDLGCGGIK
ncbi:MAG: SoxR reducing system RseC family protein [Clostridia bacterium]|nr:SoxR reducing system RseC family protein [Clostridia bacterium]